ncbi:MAG: acyl transferase [Flavobacteriaceae bacterium]|nr:acyl transferase [Flavobacteriaceae bacterium]MBT4113972.1 acyl transferase [Flavobacteriaceae bacterium]MBT4613828.1 acyl transferase [Flavobacteriaceae bacterium]MBT5246395.1 acyl transferase [Flavobacteriaceae bacterium]MBT5650740.1 acyl transferase [Flavobacteriaceae bacterium]
MIDSNKILNISSSQEFEKYSIKIFNYQFEKNTIYREFCRLTGKNPSNIRSSFEIPFLPIQFFKTHKIISSNQPIKKTFYSSGSTKNNLSKHHIIDLKLYEDCFLKIFMNFYGSPSQYNIIALLPTYLENKNSSLIYMVNKLIEKSENKHSEFYLDNYKKLKEKLLYLEEGDKKTILFGVSYALLNLIDFYKFKLKKTIIIETGGMKGKRKELIKSELHQMLKIGFGVKNINSEYGMTELISQAYSIHNEKFKSPPWMKIYIRESEDPMNIKTDNKSGGINIIDLANYNSCSFIATDDLGRLDKNGNFEILGRLDNSDQRGCNLLID